MNELVLRPALRSELTTCGLVSLWDMLRFHADAFVYVMNILNDIDLWASNPEAFKGDEQSREFIASKVDILVVQLRELNLPVSRKSAVSLRDHLRNADKGTTAASAASNIKNYRDQLRGRLEDELEGKVFYYISEKVELLENSEPLFGVKVIDCFPAANYDIEEAGKCLALRRSTASVMHLMRTLEIGLNALAKALKVPAGTENWNTLLTDIEKEIRSRTKATHGEHWKENDEPFFTEAAAHFRLVKNAWRNHSQHARSKYTDDEAQDIYNSVGAFMRHLSKRLSEPSSS